MLRSRVLPLAAAITCGLIPVLAKFAAVNADVITQGGPCTMVVNGCMSPGPVANGCRDGNTPGGTYSQASCEIVTLLNVYVCSLGDGDCTLHSPEHCAQLTEFLAANCVNNACVGGPFCGTSYYDMQTCAS
jgi:hypothetical protein